MVDNRPGGGMIIGTQAVPAAAPDGNTFGMVFSPHAANQAMHQQMPYHALTDFEPVCLGGHSIIMLVTQPNFAARNVAQVIELADARIRRCSTHRWVSARRRTWPASCSPSKPMSRSSMCRTTAARTSTAR